MEDTNTMTRERITLLIILSFGRYVKIWYMYLEKRQYPGGCPQLLYLFRLIIMLISVLPLQERLSHKELPPIPPLISNHKGINIF